MTFPAQIYVSTHSVSNSLVSAPGQDLELKKKEKEKSPEGLPKNGDKHI